MVVWDSLTGTPQRTYFSPHENGVVAMDISPDANYIVTLSDFIPQTISIWDISNEDLAEPIVSCTFCHTQDYKQICVKFNTQNVHQIVSNGKEHVVFFDWEDGVSDISYYMPQIQKSSFPVKENANAHKTQSVFLPTSTQAVTGTTYGDILVWDMSLIVDGVAQPNERRLIKVVTLNTVGETTEKAIYTLNIHNDYLVTGNADGTVRFYDQQFKIRAWFEELDLNSIMSVSFSFTEPEEAQDLLDDSLEEQDQKLLKTEEPPFRCSKFIVADKMAEVQICRAEQFESIHENKPKDSIVQSISKPIRCIAVHPIDPYLAIAGKDGFFSIWNYVTKEKIPIDYNHNYQHKDPTKMEYTPDGKCLIVGYENGIIRFLDLDLIDLEQVNEKVALRDIQEQPGKTSEKNERPVTLLTVSKDSKWFATADPDCGVCLFKKDHKYGDPSEPIEWIFSGKRRTHEIEITSIAFGEYLDENEQMKL